VPVYCDNHLFFGDVQLLRANIDYSQIGLMGNDPINTFCCYVVCFQRFCPCLDEAANGKLKYGAAIHMQETALFGRGTQQVGLATIGVQSKRAQSWIRCGDEHHGRGAITKEDTG
jgi:hypothetical protein